MAVIIASLALSLTPARGQEPIALAYTTYYASMLPDASLVTHINYGFAEVYVRDGVYQGFKLQGAKYRFNRVVALKRSNPDLKICLSFTHTVVNDDNHQDGGFSAIAASPDARRAFALDCKAFIDENGIDGIDLDWEFPGLSWSGAACDPAVDVANFTLLLKQLRATLGNDVLLTFAGYAMDRQHNTSGWRYIDITAAVPYVDFINVMCYDLDEAPHPHNAVVDATAYIDCQRAVENYHKAGVPFSKMVLGIPFYVRHSFSTSPTAVDYRKLSQLGSDYVVDNWDDQARVPYVTYNGAYWGSYDNERSIAIKGEWVRSLGMRGLMYWDAAADTDDHTLARAVWNATCLAED